MNSELFILIFITIITHPGRDDKRNDDATSMRNLINTINERINSESDREHLPGQTDKSTNGKYDKSGRTYQKYINFNGISDMCLRMLQTVM